MWTCGFLQSTSVTTPLNVCGFLLSNFAEMGWCAEMAVPSSNTAPSVKAIATPDFIGCLLLPADLQRSALALVLPRSNDGAVLKREVFDLAVEDVVQDARLVFDVGFEVHDPPVRVEGGILDRRIVGPGIDHAGDGFAIPVEDEHDVVRVGFGRSPRAQPRSFQWVTLLC